MNNSTITSDDILIEILKRIPGKTLTRFRCVSKHWNHLIRRRPDFATTHYNYWQTLAAVPTLVIFSVTHNLKRIFYTINDEGEAHHHLTIDTEQYGFKTHYRTPQCINGVFCLFDYHSLLVCNIATGEIISLPVSSLASNYWYTPWYFFGYDPVNDEYKVLCVWTSSRSRDCFRNRPTKESEVFTVGKSTEWRTIESLPHDSKNSGKESVCVDGFIYWVADFDSGNKTGLVSFDVRAEKLRITELPSGPCRGIGEQVVEFEGDVALVNREDSKLVILDDDSPDEIWTLGFDAGFKFPQNPNDLVITSDAETFFIFKRSEPAGHFELFHYDNDGILLRTTRITGLEDASYRWGWRSALRHAIHEYVENIHPLARN